MSETREETGMSKTIDEKDEGFIQVNALETAVYALMIDEVFADLENALLGNDPQYFPVIQAEIEDFLEKQRSWAETLVEAFCDAVRVQMQMGWTEKVSTVPVQKQLNYEPSVEDIEALYQEHGGQ